MADFVSDGDCPSGASLLSRRRVLQVAAAVALAGAVASGGAVQRVEAAAARTITRGPTDKKIVALTWDCGSDRGYAPSILNTLATYGVRCSFGITGKWAEANSDVVRRVTNEGHHLFNHTYSHRSFTGATSNTAPLTSTERRQELDRTEQIFKNLTGVGGRPWFRPPYGDYNSGVLNDLGANGFSYNAMWSLDVLGWRGLSQDQIVSRVLSNHGNGYIYLLHVGSQSLEGPALPRMIEGLRARGYGFATLPVLLAGTGQPPPGGGTFRVGDIVKTTTSLRLRTQPSTSGRVIATMPTGTRCTVVGGPRSANGYTWYQLRTPYGTGWAAGRYLTRV